MAVVIKPKKSETASSAPTTSDLAAGEIAVNTADQKIYIRVNIFFQILKNLRIGFYHYLIL